MTAKALLQAAGDGTAVPAGSVGERLTATSSGVSFHSTTAAVASLSVTPGVWILYGHVIAGTAGATVSTASVINVEISTTSGSISGDGESHAALSFAAGYYGASQPRVATGQKYVNVSSTTTYYLNAASTYTASTPTSTNSGTTETKLFAIRIA